MLDVVTITEPTPQIFATATEGHADRCNRICGDTDCQGACHAEDNCRSEVGLMPCENPAETVDLEGNPACQECVNCIEELAQEVDGDRQHWDAVDYQNELGGDYFY